MSGTQIESKVAGSKKEGGRNKRPSKEGIKGRAIKALGAIFTSDWFSRACLAPAVLILAIVLLISLKREKGG